MIARAIAASVPFKWLLAILSTVLARSNNNCAGRKRLCTRGQQRSCISILASGDQSPARPPTSPGRGARPIGNASLRGRNQRTAASRLVLSRIGRSRGEELNSASHGLWTRGLLIRRHIADGDLAFFTTWCPAATSIKRCASKATGAIEDSFETAKNEFGSITMRADPAWCIATFLCDARLRHDAVIRHRANPPPPKNTRQPRKDKSIANPSLIRCQSRVAGSPSTPRKRTNPHTSSLVTLRRAHQALAQRAHYKANGQL